MEIDYEKKYEEALAKARAGKTLEEIFPEMNESEDERIREWLVDYFKAVERACIHWDISPERIVSYLEKQKDLEKMIVVSPEVWDNAISDAYENGKKDSEKQKENPKTADSIPSNCVSDAKWASSVLTNAIVSLSDAVDYNCNEPFRYKQEIDDLKKLREEIEKQKEQKLTESISRLTVQGKGVYKICPRCKSRMIRDDSKVYTSMPPKYGYNCPKCGTMEFDTVMYDNPEMEEQKPAEITPNQFDGITYGMKGYSSEKPAEQDSEEVFDKIDNSFRKGREVGFREGVESVKTSEWSEEDERILKGIIGLIDHNQHYGVGNKEMLDWLKSLRPPQYCENCRLKKSVQGWKPSEEQMRFLLAVINEPNNAGSESCHLILKELYEQLKTL